MAVKVETLRSNFRIVPKRREFVRAAAQAARRWMQDGQLGSSDLEMRIYTGSR